MTKKCRILIVEDEEAISKGLVDVFVYHGYEVEAAKDGKTGLSKALTGNYDLIILDVMLPELDGFTVCNQVRSKDRDQPIIMLTAKTTDEDIVTGLTLGADDYVGKPFSIQELVLRVEAVLRRSQKKKRLDAFLQIGAHLSVDTQNLTGTLVRTTGGSPEALEFTRREVDILSYLMAHTDRPVSRGELLAEVWDYRKSSHVDTRTVDIHIAKLRRKIEITPKNPSLLLTVRGEGYQLDLGGK